MERDLTSSITPAVALKIQEIASDTATAGEIVDLKGFQGADIAVQSGTLTDGTQTISIQDGDDSGLSDAATVDSSFIIGTLPVFVATEDDTVKHFGYVGKKRYIRITNTSSGTTTSAFIGAQVIKGFAASRPTV